MQKANNLPRNDDMLPEYDFKGKKGVRGKYAKDMKQGYTVRVTNEDGTVTVKHFMPRENAILLDPDVRVYFPDSESVNRALGSLIALIPEKSGEQMAEKKARYTPK